MKLIKIGIALLILGVLTLNATARLELEITLFIYLTWNASMY